MWLFPVRGPQFLAAVPPASRRELSLHVRENVCFVFVMTYIFTSQAIQRMSSSHIDFSLVRASHVGSRFEIRFWSLFCPLCSEAPLTKQQANISYCYTVKLEMTVWSDSNVSSEQLCSRDMFPLCQLFGFCVLFALPRCRVLEVVVTRGRCLRFDNGVQVSLGNRRDLTQDAELPLGFFYAPSPLCLTCIPAFLPSQCPLAHWRKRWVFRWRAVIL